MFNRKLMAVSILLAGCSLASSGFAQDTGPRDGVRGQLPRAELRDARGPARQRPARMLRGIDTNDDGLVSLTEFTSRGTHNYSRQFERMDRDDDGYITEDEFRPQRRGPAEDLDVATLRACIEEAGGTPKADEDRFATADKNGDGALSQEEFFLQLEQGAYDRFAQLDTDGDEQLTSTELQSGAQNRREQAHIVRECVAEQLDPFL